MSFRSGAACCTYNKHILIPRPDHHLIPLLLMNIHSLLLDVGSVVDRQHIFPAVSAEDGLRYQAVQVEPYRCL